MRKFHSHSKNLQISTVKKVRAHRKIAQETPCKRLVQKKIKCRRTDTLSKKGDVSEDWKEMKTADNWNRYLSKDQYFHGLE